MVLDDGTIHPMTEERKGQGLAFDSLKEARHWLVLLERRNKGEISFLQRQKRIRLLSHDGQLLCVYVADFVYLEQGRRVVCDVKSPMTKKLAIYKLKKRMLQVLLGIEIVEV